MDTGTASQEGYVQSPVALPQEDCSILSPTLADILSDDRILRFYQCVKDIKTQNEPKQTAAMFFALCHALGDTVSFLKVPNMSKIMFRQEQQIFAVNVAGTQHDTVQLFQQQQQQQHQQPNNATTNTNSNDISLVSGSASGLMHDVDSTHSSNNLFSATAADGSPQHLLQAALASVNPHAVPEASAIGAGHAASASTVTNLKRRNNKNDDGTPKKAKKASPRDKEYSVRCNEIIKDLLRVSDPDLLHQANIIDGQVKMIIQGHERLTKSGALEPILRFAEFANLSAHYDCDFAPKNAGVYYNYEYFQLYLAYRDLEIERQKKQQAEGGDPRPILVQCRTEIEKVLERTNWEAIRRRLTIGERICQVCGVVGRGFLLLSKQVSGRKLLHNFNTNEWGEFMREFQKPESQPLLQTLQTKYSPERFYGPRQEMMAIESTSAVISPIDVALTNVAVDNTTNDISQSEPEQTQGQQVEEGQQETSTTDSHHDDTGDVKGETFDNDATAAAMAAAVASVVGTSGTEASTPISTAATVDSASVKLD